MKIYLVGGAVRDQLLGFPVREKDWVVVGATPEQMLKLGFKQVGKDFPVFLHPQSHEEYALARRERKISPGYTGFACDTSTDVSLTEDLLRRDLTINAIAQDQQGSIIDPYHGQADLKAKILRHISPAFAEDPVRVLRIARFAARYADLGFTVAPETRVLIRQIVNSGEIRSLVAERVWKELVRALGEKSPGEFFLELERCEALAQLFPQIKLTNCTIKALEYAALVCQDTLVLFAVLTHNLTLAELHAFARRYRIPKDYMMLAQLVLENHTTILHFAELTAAELITLFSKLDAVRRPERFKKCILSCAALANLYQLNFDAQKIMQCVLVSNKIDIQQLLAKGFKSNELGEQIHLQRIQSLSNYLHN